MEHRPDDIEETLPRKSAVSRFMAGRGTPVLYVAFFCDDPLETPSRHLLGPLDSVTIGRSRARSARRDLAAGTLELGLPDPWTSSRHARLSRSGAAWQIEDSGSRNGVRINGEPVQNAALQDGDLIELGHTLLYYRADAGRELPPGLPNPPGPDHTPAFDGSPAAGFTTLSPALELEMAKAWTLGGAELPLLIQGVSGSG